MRSAGIGLRLNSVIRRWVARLFKGLGGYYCRPCCGNPVYECQLKNKTARSYLQAYRLRQRLGGSCPVLDAIPQRPYGMRRKTYARLCERIPAADSGLLQFTETVPRRRRIAPRFLGTLAIFIGIFVIAWTTWNFREPLTALRVADFPFIGAVHP